MGFTVDYRLNRDCIMDLALSESLLEATTQAATILEVDSEERTRWAEVRAQLAPYPKAEGPWGELWLDVVDAPTEWVYNIPVTLAPVFPGATACCPTGWPTTAYGKLMAATATRRISTS